MTLALIAFLPLLKLLGIEGDAEIESLGEHLWTSFIYCCTFENLLLTAEGNNVNTPEKKPKRSLIL